jgi:hypothetical protein
MSLNLGFSALYQSDEQTIHSYTYHYMCQRRTKINLQSKMDVIVKQMQT